MTRETRLATLLQLGVTRDPPAHELMADDTLDMLGVMAFPSPVARCS
ncbi:hypothetical protein EV667_4267 [Ancylobacter aquaticus]|uniref:Uncharacterized protein n=1 Tax=Ancylobacter aquaticus TaxID=100 RepID=A0A4R1HGC7_ANCAQ|nr:hypothetical protein EV667_4267 [Ancylobacter aquaticus]